ncbi:Disease resistance protein [Corchorus olitorius]|uniref:Disease resistance protein n=1 Tax=Corchorus olitorius TaxID=93759 RepID=A0A1R3I322_9ROSI|nr:Disease resistance protein [Corchorus olitorius]
MASDEIKEMKVLLRSMRSFLMDADTTEENSQTQKAWVNSIRDMACEIEDTIDEFTYDMNMKSQRNLFQRGLHFHQDLLVRSKAAATLQNINKKIQTIAERTHGVHDLEEMVRPKKKERKTEDRFSTCDSNWKKRLSESSLFFHEDDLVGIKEGQHKLLTWLMSEEPRRTVISVVGIGGSGKTTLVANTFNKQVVRQHFDFCAWITVSQQYDIEELFRSMLKEVYRKAEKETPVMLLNTMGYKELLEELVPYMQSRRYLVVLDDVWSSRSWQEMSIALPEGLLGSRIMLTTRKEDVAPSQSGFLGYIHRIQPLKEDEAWKLFCMRAFPDNLDGCASDLDSLAWNLVEKCEGLPLAIVALGSLMSSKKLIGEWKRVHDNLNWELSNNPALERVKSILLLSYHDLSFHLKQCFLYCCIFPEDCMIYRRRLIRLWMAEGFLEQVNDVAPEVVAESYIMELICRNLLEVQEWNASGRPKAFKMHNILRELALSLSREEKIVVVSDGRNGVEENGIRRCSMTMKGEGIQPGNGLSQLRSLFIFVVGESSFNKLSSGFKLLRVLDLENTPITVLPSEFGIFFNLRYLNLTRTQVEVLPESTGKFVNLQTLLFKKAKIKELPCEIVKLQNLRYLSGSICCSGNRYDSVRVPPNVCRMKSLQVLSFVERTDSLIKQLKEMTQLKTLGVGHVKEADAEDLCSAIGEMKDLGNLHLYATSGHLKLDALLQAPPHLERLFLNGRMEKLPHWFNQLQNLTHLTLQNSELGESLLSHIQALSNLSYLSLGDTAYNQEKLCFGEGFQNLRFLRIFNFPLLNVIVIENNVMTGLEELEIVECRALRGLPYGLDHLTDLKVVSFYYVSSEIVKQLYEQGNIDTGSPTIQDIGMTKSDDDEGKSKWFYKILNV